MNKLWVKLAVLAAFVSAVVLPASAGNIALTGHDDDYHYYYGDPNAGAQLSALISYASSGDTGYTTKPVLAIDMGTGELWSDLTKLSIGFTAVNTSTGLTGTSADNSLFDPTKYSAIVIASDYLCGGCDNTPAAEANIVADKAAIGNFLNGGGGIVALAGAYTDAPFYYSFLPDTAAPFGSPPSSPYYATSVGIANGIPAVSGDPTHNFFNEPGTSGTSALYQVAEREGDATTCATTAPSETACAAETLILTGAEESGGGLTGGGGTTGVPEPSSFLMLGSGLLGLAGVAKRKLLFIQRA